MPVGSHSAEQPLELYAEAEARTERLVATKRFQSLLIDLTGYLVDPAHLIVSGELATKLLRGRDPQKSSGVRGATFAQFASWHPGPQSDRKMAAIRRYQRN